MRKVFWLSLIAIIIGSSLPLNAQSGVPSQRLDRLTRGVNVPHWFWEAETNNLEGHLQLYFTAQDAALLRQSGIDHIRLPVDVALFWDWEQPTTLKPEYLPALDAAIQLLLEHDLAVIVTPFGDFDERMTNPEYVEAGIAFWGQFAAHLAQFDPNYLYMMVSNEPLLIPADWQPIRDRLLAAMRDSAPDHTFVASTSLRYGYGDSEWGMPDALLASEPAADPNVLYSLHFYEPMVFTHQGADWSGWYENLHAIPYPSSPANVQPTVEILEREITDENLGWIPGFIRSYGIEEWDRARLSERLEVLIEAATERGMPLLVDEFGAYLYGGVAPADRINWLMDIRMILEANGVGWTMWDYAGGFRLGEGQPGTRTLDVGTALALGLTLEVTQNTQPANETQPREQADAPEIEVTPESVEGRDENSASE